ncbi:hypothetical protein U0070_006765 [Myodes glareolus]|uniref:Uncharacterized protein n=1 Tax=Myodes glareolus TaxID=447135 RepID=A0AAW0HYZ6_MYOGA
MSGAAGDIEDDEDDEDNEDDNLPPQKKPVWVDEDDEDEELVDMMNNRFWKDIMKNASESKLSKDKLQKRLTEEFRHAMGGGPDWAEPGHKRRKSSDEMKRMKVICCKGLGISYPHPLLFREEF